MVACERATGEDLFVVSANKQAATRQALQAAFTHRILFASSPYRLPVAGGTVKTAAQIDLTFSRLDSSRSSAATMKQCARDDEHADRRYCGLPYAVLSGARLPRRPSWNTSVNLCQASKLRTKHVRVRCGDRVRHCKRSTSKGEGGEAWCDL